MSQPTVECLHLPMVLFDFHLENRREHGVHGHQPCTYLRLRQFAIGGFDGVLFVGLNFARQSVDVVQIAEEIVVLQTIFELFVGQIAFEIAQLPQTLFQGVIFLV